MRMKIEEIYRNPLAKCETTIVPLRFVLLFEDKILLDTGS